MKEIYFDCAATTKPSSEVLDSFNKVAINEFANANSNHLLGSQSQTLLNKCRSQVANYFKVKDNEVIFTSGATEANNIAINGIAKHNKSWANHLITTKAEHPSVLKVFEELESKGFEVTYLNYDKEGNLDLKQLSQSLKNTTSLVSIMCVNNETGYIFNIDEAYKIIKKDSKALLHVDATQGVGKIKINANSYDLLTMSSHKIEGLKGSGILIKKNNVNLSKTIFGGDQEYNLRPGTTPLPLIASTTTAIRLAFNNMEKKIANVTKLNNYLRKELEAIDEVVIVSPKNASKFILSFALSRHKASVISEGLSLNHIYVGSKSACSEKIKSYSTVLFNAGYDKQICENAIRLSFCGNEDIEEGKEFIKVLKNLLKETKEYYYEK